MVNTEHEQLSVRKQCHALGIWRSNVYYGAREYFMFKKNMVISYPILAILSIGKKSFEGMASTLGKSGS